MARVRAHSAWVEDLEPVQGAETSSQKRTLRAVKEVPTEAIPAKEEFAGPRRVDDLDAMHRSASTAISGGSTYRLIIERCPAQMSGICFDVTDGVSLIVVSILPGSIQAWNDAHPESFHLEVNERIVEANGQGGNAGKMIFALKQNTTWDLLVQRPFEYSAVIHRHGSLSLGMELRYAPNGTTLLVSEVEDGPIHDWNVCSTTWQVRKFDRIVELNGVRGAAELLLEAAVGADRLELRVLHYD